MKADQILTSLSHDADEVLSARNIAVRLGGRRVLREVNFSVRPGEFVGIIGPNGAGKTTLLRTLLGLVRLDEGQLNKPVRQPGYVPQRHEFVWDFPISVEDVVLSGRVRQIGWFRRAKRADYEASMEALERVKMSHLGRRPVGELSGGQRQRVLVARALALKPDILLLDEPFTGLDMPTQDMLSQLFQELAAESVAVVMTTHDLAAAMHFCSRLCLLNRTVIADGSAQELSDPKLWMDAFQIGADNPLLRVLNLVEPTTLASQEGICQEGTC